MTLLKKLGVLCENSDSILKNKLSPYFQFPHKCMYDDSRLIEILREMGFEASARGAYDSDIVDIRIVELEGRKCFTSKQLRTTKFNRTVPAYWSLMFLQSTDFGCWALRPPRVVMNELEIQDFWNRYPCGDLLVGGLQKHRGDYETFFIDYDSLR